MTFAALAAPNGVIRVMIVDDSAVVRGLVARWIGEEPGFEVVASCRTGRAAVDDVARCQPHVIVLDVEMPEMDGVTALPLLLKSRPEAAIVMASTLTRGGADVSLRCLALGASDVIAKPSANVGQTEYRRELVAKIRALGDVVIRRTSAAAVRAAPLDVLSRVSAGRFDQRPAGLPALKPFSSSPVRAIVIGASTGGPKALVTVAAAIAPAIGKVPVLVTQHMPATFTAALAEHIALASRRPAREATHGEPLSPGAFYIAPGGRHFGLAVRGGVPGVAIGDWEPENFCKPSVDPMFRDAAAAYGSGLLAIMLTGMGADGAAGVRAVSAAGGSIIAQDEATSVVWGMPGAAVATNCCSAVLPLGGIGPKIVSLLERNRS